MARELRVENFIDGIIDSIEAKSIPRGAFKDNLNFLTKGDKFQIRGGELLLGTDVVGSGKVTGLGVSLQADGEQILYWSHGRKVKYFDEDTDDSIEVGSNILASDADGEDITFAQYVTNHGNQFWFSSPNSNLFKIMSANPGDVSNMFDSALNFKGKILIQENRMWLWNTVKDKTGIRLSFIDSLKNTTVIDEDIGNGDGATKTFTATLVFKAGGAKRTCFAIVVNDTAETEIFTDDYNGNLVGNQGGTGTINYTTGAISVTFNTAPAGGQDILVDYQYEDSTDDGIADFGFSATRLAGEGDILRQDDGGDLQGVFPYKNINYCIHAFKTWQLQLTIDDTNAENVIYRNNVGIPNHRAAVATGEGIYLVNDIIQNEPKFQILRFGASGFAEVEPITLSDKIDLNRFRFNLASTVKFGDLIITACRTSDVSVNNRLLVYNRKFKSFDIMEGWYSKLIVWKGKLIGGSSISNNIFQLFSGVDDDDSLITGFVEGHVDNFDIPRLKKLRRLELDGEIQINQSFDILLAPDNGPFVKVGTQNGNDSNVDLGSSVAVGAPTNGTTEIGGGSSPNDVNAHLYVKTIKLGLDKFERLAYKIVPTGIGFMSVSLINYRDIRIKQQKIPNKYR